MTAQDYSLKDQRQRASSSQKRRLPRIPGITKASGLPLGRQLLQTLLPVTLLPLAVASGLGIFVTKSAENEDVILALKQEALLASETASLFLDDSFKTVENLVISPSIQQVIARANAKALERNLLSMNNFPLYVVYLIIAVSKMTKMEISDYY